MSKSKRIYLSFFILFCLILSSVFSAPTSLSNTSVNVLATVTVAGRTETITKAELDQKKNDYQKAGLASTDKELLDVLVNDKVFTLSAKRDNVVVTDSDVNDRIKAIKSQMEAQVGYTITDEEFNSYIQQSLGEYSMDDYKEDLRNTLLVEKYVRTSKSAELDKPVSVSDSEINNFYRRNASQFVNPEYVRISHIYKKKGSNSSEDNRIKETLRGVLSDIKAGKITFERAVQQYSEDDSSKTRGGDVGIVTGSLSQTLGDDFIDSVFALDIGEISSDILTSNDGFHIVKVTAHENQKFLKIDDYVAPENPQTVREYIRQGLQSQKQQEQYAKVVNDFVDDLKKSATIIFTSSDLK